MGSHHLFLNYYGNWYSVSTLHLHCIKVLKLFSKLLVNHINSFSDREPWKSTTELLSTKQTPHFLGWHSKTIHKSAPSSLMSKYILLYTPCSSYTQLLALPLTLPLPLTFMPLGHLFILSFVCSMCSLTFTGSPIHLTSSEPSVKPFDSSHRQIFNFSPFYTLTALFYFYLISLEVIMSFTLVTTYILRILKRT